MTVVKERETFVMPEARIGDLVHWFPGGDQGQTPHPAFVAESYRDNLTLLVMNGDLHNFLIRDSVRHVSDPKVREDWAFEFGAWDYSPQHLERLALVAKVAELEARLGTQELRNSQAQKK